MEQLPLNVPFQRLMGFTIPKHGEFLVCDYNDCWAVRLGSAPEVTEIGGSPYEVAARPDFVGAAGTGSKGVLRVGETEIDYRFRPDQESVAVGYRSRGKAGSINFRLISGDWFTASLSDDGAYAILAEPDALHVYAT